MVAPPPHPRCSLAQRLADRHRTKQPGVCHTAPSDPQCGYMDPLPVGVQDGQKDLLRAGGDQGRKGWSWRAGWLPKADGRCRAKGLASDDHWGLCRHVSESVQGPRGCHSSASHGPGLPLSTCVLSSLPWVTHPALCVPPRSGRRTGSLTASATSSTTTWRTACRLSPPEASSACSSRWRSPCDRPATPS